MIHSYIRVDGGWFRREEAINFSELKPASVIIDVIGFPIGKTDRINNLLSEHLIC